MPRHEVVVNVAHCRRLPPEIWQMITEDLLTLDLYSISLTSRDLHLVALSRLYTHIERFPDDPRVVFKFLQTISKKPELALRVRSVALVCSYEEYTDRSLEKDISVLCRALRAMHNVKDLEIGFIYPWGTLEECTFRLERLRITSTDHHPPLPYSALGFLRTQTELSVFEWDIQEYLRWAVPGNIDASMPAFPNLQRLVYTDNLVPHMLNGHAVPEVLINSLPEEPLEWLGTLTGTIESLTVEVHEPAFDYFPAQVTTVRALVLNLSPYLRIVGELALFYHTDWYLGISQFQNLTSFALTGNVVAGEYDVSPGILEAVQLRLVVAMHVACPSLTDVHLPIGRGRIGISFEFAGGKWGRVGEGIYPDVEKDQVPGGPVYGRHSMVNKRNRLLLSLINRSTNG